MALKKPIKGFTSDKPAAPPPGPPPIEKFIARIAADLPAFGRKGGEIDVTVSAIGDSTSLRGGTLLLTPLVGADGEVYAVAQGPVSVGGAFSVTGQSATVTKNHTTAGTIPGGAPPGGPRGSRQPPAPAALTRIPGAAATWPPFRSGAPPSPSGPAGVGDSGSRPGRGRERSALPCRTPAGRPGRSSPCGSPDPTRRGVSGAPPTPRR